MTTDMKKEPVAASLTYEAGLELIRKFAHVLENSYASYTWAVLMEEEDGTYSYWERHNNPCYGEMRPYAIGYLSNGPYIKDLMPESQRKVHKPGDLFWPFPLTGKPVLLAVPFGPKYKAYSDLLEDVILNAEISPWRNVLKGFEVVRNKDGTISGLVITDTNIEPTVMVNMFRKIKNDVNINQYISVREKYPDLSKLEAFVFSQIYVNTKVVNSEYGSVFGMNYSIKRILNGDTTDQTGGTFYQRYAYDRPKVDWIFYDAEKNFPKLFGGGGWSSTDVTPKKVYEAFIKEARG